MRFESDLDQTTVLIWKWVLLCIPEEFETVNYVTEVTYMTEHVICNLLHSVPRCNTTGGRDLIQGCQFLWHM